MKQIFENVTTQWVLNLEGDEIQDMTVRDGDWLFRADQVEVTVKSIWTGSELTRGLIRVSFSGPAYRRPGELGETRVGRKFVPSDTDVPEIVRQVISRCGVSALAAQTWTAYR